MRKLHLPDALSVGQNRALEKSDSPSHKGIRPFQPAHHSLSIGGSRLSPKLRQDDPELVSAVGALWLLAAVIAARRTDKWEALGRLDRSS